jgi:hypothetical protein
MWLILDRGKIRSKQRSGPSLLLAVASEVRFSRSKDYEARELRVVYAWIPGICLYW